MPNKMTKIQAIANSRYIWVPRYIKDNGTAVVGHARSKPNK